MTSTSTPPADPDPAEIATIAVFHSKVGRDRGISRRHCEDIAQEVLKALRRSDWRIVRTDDDEYSGEDVQIIEEWTGG